MNDFKIKAVKKSFFITLAYVGSGTVAVMCLGFWGNAGEFIERLMTIILFLTIPVTCISFAIMYSGGTAYGTLLLIQSIIFLLFWLILFLIIQKRAQKILKENQAETPPEIR
ncbi:MAG: hypothetical protein ABI203_11545 [Mucilaginibacter sp.]